jgi:hypothetical protein
MTVVRTRARSEVALSGTVVSLDPTTGMGRHNESVNFLSVHEQRLHLPKLD